MCGTNPGKAMQQPGRSSVIPPSPKWGTEESWTQQYGENADKKPRVSLSTAKFLDTGKQNKVCKFRHDSEGGQKF